MKSLLIFIAGILFFVTNSTGQNVGVNTPTPEATLDVNGDVIFRTAAVTVADGITIALDVNNPRFSYYRLTGPTADFTIAGITAGNDGRLLTLFNRTGFTMQLNNEDVNAAVTDMIVTGTNADITIINKGIVNLQYDATEQKWIVKSSSKGSVAGGGGFWDANGIDISNNNTGNVGIGTTTPAAKLDVVGNVNINGASTIEFGAGVAGKEVNAGKIGYQSFGPNIALDIVGAGTTGTNRIIKFWNEGGAEFLGNVGIGTNNPYTKLMIETPYNTSGWYHIGRNGNDSIVVGEGIGGVSAAIGTFTEHALRLTAGALGRVQVYPTGDVVIGDNNVGSIGRLTVKTTNNADGISHIGDNGNILKTIMGGTSAGIGTFSNTNMRIFSGGTSAIFVASGTNNVGIGKEFPINKLEVNGTIRSKEVIVENINWADYVFDKKYKLPLLSDVEKFINQNKHLPNILSAAEIEKNGLHLGDTQKRMMEKIEELTLYIIQQQKEINALKEKFKHLNKVIK